MTPRQLGQVFVATAASVTTLASIARGDVIQQQAAFQFPLSPGNDFLIFDLFDDEGGSRVLQEVALELDGQACLTGTLENDAPQTMTGVIIYLQGFLRADLADLVAACDLLEFAFAPTFAPSDGIPGSGADFWDFGTLCAQGTATVTVSDPGALDAFVGTGTIGSPITGAGDPAVQGMLGPYTLTVLDFYAEGTVTVLYSFSTCPADVTGDGMVDVLDLLAVIGAWGNPGGIEDINNDGIVDVLDLLIVITAWGPC